MDTDILKIFYFYNKLNDDDTPTNNNLSEQDNIKSTFYNIIMNDKQLLKKYKSIDDIVMNIYHITLSIKSDDKIAILDNREELYASKYLNVDTIVYCDTKRKKIIHYIYNKNINGYTRNDYKLSKKKYK